MVASLREHLRTVHKLSVEEMLRLVPTSVRKRRKRQVPNVFGGSM